MVAGAAVEGWGAEVFGLLSLHFCELRVSSGYDESTLFPLNGGREGRGLLAGGGWGDGCLLDGIYVASWI